MSHQRVSLNQEIGSSQNEENPQVPGDCGICREGLNDAVRLGCSHVFCWRCIKSAYEINGICPICRAEIGIEFNFRQQDIIGPIRTPVSNSGYYWFYEGYRGWWMYDEDTNKKLEEAFERGEEKIEVFLAGAIYIISLKNKFQRRQDGDGKARKICRATLDLEKIIGIAGLRAGDFAGLLESMRFQQATLRV